MANEFIEDTLQLALVDGSHMIEALASKPTDHQFAVRILPWRGSRRRNLLQTEAPHPSLEFLAVDSVTVAE